MGAGFCGIVRRLSMIAVLLSSQPSVATSYCSRKCCNLFSVKPLAMPGARLEIIRPEGMCQSFKIVSAYVRETRAVVAIRPEDMDILKTVALGIRRTHDCPQSGFSRKPTMSLESTTMHLPQVQFESSLNLAQCESNDEEHKPARTTMGL